MAGRVLASTAAVLLAVMVSACGTSAPGPASDDTPQPATSTVAAIAVGSPGPTAALPPDADGNPPCPASAVWGTSPTGKGIVVTYWTTGSDLITVLVRGRSGDVAQTVNAGSDDRFHIFEFVDVDPMTVHGVLIMSNTNRCYATQDPKTSPR
jgi:hypothetical protein